MNSTVAIARTESLYPLPPFGPAEPYPELAQLGGGAGPVQHNPVYRAVRSTLLLLGLDRARAETSAWNPLGELVRPGGTVLVKPNLVTTSYRDSRLECIVTHASVLRPIIDYALLAVGSGGRVLIGDCPERDMDLDLAFALNGMNHLLAHYAASGAPVQFVDFRNQYAYYSPASSPIGRRLLAVARRDRNPVRYRTFDLGVRSEFHGVDEGRMQRVYGAYYDTAETVAQHTGGHHRYELVQPFLDADLVVSAAKLKTHLKAGVTLTLKNFIGINGNKNYLPHHTEGDPSDGGDAYARPASTRRGRLARRAERFLHTRILGTHQTPLTEALTWKCIAAERRLLRPPEADVKFDNGAWSGNDTLWRTVADVARLAHFGGSDGEISPAWRRTFLGIIDGVIGGDRNGPKHSTPHPSGVIVAGRSLLSVDCVATALMGLEPSRIKYLDALMKPHELDLSEDVRAVEVAADESSLRNILHEPAGALGFRPADSWERLLRPQMVTR